MNALLRFGLIGIIAHSTIFAITAQTQPPDPSAIPSTNRVVALPQVEMAGPWEVKSRQAHQTEWMSLRMTTNTQGRVRTLTNIVTELGTHLNIQDADGQWHPANPSFQITERGAEARNTAHHALLAPNINVSGAIQIEKDGVIIKAHPLSIGYYDPVDGRSVLFAQLQNAIGWLTSSNEIVYSNCFNGLGLRASVRYRNSVAGLSQDLIVHEPPGMTPESLGMSLRARFELFTEFLPETPEPAISERLMQSETDPIERQTMQEPDLYDATLSFNDLRMGPGKAFSLSGNQDHLRASGIIPVCKAYAEIQTRRLLIESVEHRRIAPLLEQLGAPTPSGIRTNAMLLPKATNLFAKSIFRALPPMPQTKTLSGRIQMAKSAETKMYAAAQHEPAFLLDWELHASAPVDYVFREGDTYVISTPVQLSQATFMGGCVVKYFGDGMLEVTGPITCLSEPLRPIVFTSRDDDTIGIQAPGSNGNPENRYANPALLIEGPPSDLKYIRIRHALTGIYYQNNGPNTLRHAQLVHCFSPLVSMNTDPLTVRNVLVHDADQAFAGPNYVFAEHLTAHSAILLAGFETAGVTLKNSLVVDVWQDSLQNYSSQNSIWLTEDAGAFQTAGAGEHYLSENNTLNLQTAADPSIIDPALREELKEMTTYPPFILKNEFTGCTVSSLDRRLIRDEAVKCAGYHYPAMDYALNVIVGGCTLVLTNGCVAGLFGDYGICLDGGNLISEGSPLKPNWIVHYTAVQEVATNWGSAIQTTTAVLGYTTFIYQGSDYPTIRLRFTNFERPKGNYYQLYLSSDRWLIRSLEVQHCQIRGGGLWFDNIGTTLTPVIAFTNNVLYDLSTALFMDNIEVYAFNNLYTNCSTELFNGSSTTWVVRDNIFDHGTLDAAANIENRCNAYIGFGSYHLPGSGGGDVTGLTSLSYQVGPLGPYYLPSTADWADNGSRTVAAAGLVHYTTRADQAKDTATVTIGYHYPAVDAPNLALGGTASQSSTILQAVASRAIDGNPSGVFQNNSVTHTDTQNQPYWQLDLGQVFPVQSIRIWNRTDCCSSRLSNYYVFVSESPMSSPDLNTVRNQSGVTSYYLGLPAGTPTEIPIHRPGQHIRVQLAGANYLSLAEVEVLPPSALVDTDADGLSDIGEDPNGNGTRDTGETSYNDADTDDDGLVDGQEAVQWRSPLIPEPNVLWLTPARSPSSIP